MDWLDGILPSWITFAGGSVAGGAAGELSYAWAIVLGLVQGLTEFLPISSSGHLALVENLGMDAPLPLAFDVLLHLATLIVVIGAFAKDALRLWREARIVFLYILVGSIPAAVVGFTLEDRIDQIRHFPLIICGALVLNAILLVVADRLNRAPKPIGELGFLGSLVVGVGQALAITPGLSRSGWTITGGLASRLERPDAIRFSFLLMIPAVGGASLVHAVKGFDELGALPLGPTVAGFLAALLSGIAALKLLTLFVRQRRLVIFAVYCALVGIVGLVYFGWIRG